MTRILIHTRVSDAHGLYGALALKRLGHEVIRWFGADYPIASGLTATVSNQSNLEWRLEQAGDLWEGGFDTIWYRRPVAPLLREGAVENLMHPDDRAFALDECKQMAKGLWRGMSKRAMWVNPLEGAAAADNKLYQLVTARSVGLKIPESCFSSRPDDIRHFLRTHRQRGTIYKPFLQGKWPLENDGVALLSTRLITEEQLPSDKTLSLCPGIFQVKIDKKFEVRATFVGSNCMAVAIDTQANPRTKIDGRIINQSRLDMEPIQLPEPVYEKTRQLMNELGIVFACIDFIVTPDDEYVFLEANEMGQFGWVENKCPELTILDCLCRFLGSGDPNYTYARPSNPIRLLDIKANAEFINQFSKDSVDHFMHSERAAI